MLEVELLRGRIDVLEREGNGWSLHGIAASTRVRADQLDVLAFQVHLAERAGLEVRSIWLQLLDARYRRPSGIESSRAEMRRLIQGHDVTGRVRARAEDVAEEVARWRRVIESREPPEIHPSEHCLRPYRCPFFEHCREPLPDDWLGHFPGLTPAWKASLHEAGASRFSDVPREQVRTPPQQLALRAAESGRPAYAGGLDKELERLAPPALYLDFEAWAPAIPRFAGTRPQQVIPCQWSLHALQADGRLRHAEFLAEPTRDPRRDLVEALLAAIAEHGPEASPIFVYSGFESDCLAELARDLPERARALEQLRGRLVDLYALVRSSVYALSFRGSFALKRVTPALVPGFSWQDLAPITHGGDAQAALARLSTDELAGAQRDLTRRRLLAYCARDTLALVELHRALRKRVALS